MIRHIVLIKFKPEIDTANVQALFNELHAIEDKLDGLVAVSSGASESPEKMERGYMHGFVTDFLDWDALQAYQDHPDHKALGAKLVASAVGGIEGILCFDYEV